ncbi:putative exosome subunit rrp6p-like protein [Trypanosoma rangeli]|uniref:Putative exosome subunit rrp6p-like protein n=1 Tax=Trypanosoma rangeli TaxID=5698 RepID=A0A3R7LLL0_TRYRA|nr:putative exosome subunit rrp6p-like protein [Trypanosoma rangeli]RNE99536.1 putative exosome subunit rrp6p-like protein [Trypanosoma rangeli]|eukprot:RNE99536.1 putative exosome subunit rrp6p-like protein [Trypanosoma rangeli]
MSGKLPQTKDIVNGAFGLVKEYSKLASELPLDDYDYHMAFPGFRQQIRRHSDSLVEFMDRCCQLLPEKRRTTFQEGTDTLTDQRRAAVMEAVDSLLENVDGLLDDLKGRRLNAKEQLSVTFGSELQISSSAVGGGDYVVRPQLTFDQPVDNRPTPFSPVYYDEKGERHVAQPGVHPFAEVIKKLSIPEEQLIGCAETPYLPLAACPLLFVDSTADLEEVVLALLKEKEIAVDLEHHDFYSYQGFTCLMQISTRREDIVIDCLKLRSSMHLLAPVFLSPSILKVFHGAREDVRWLQKDFGLYLVNFFDTGIALQVLHMPHSLAFAVDHFCQVKLNKKYQTADWRIRPIPAEMVAYARQDTHFLLYVYDRLKTLLLNSEGRASIGNLLVHVMNESRRLSLELYEKPQLDPDATYKIALGRSLGGLSSTQMQVARDVFNWRDAAAREVDDSPSAVLHLSAVLSIATKLPTSANDILKCCTPVSMVVRTNVMKLVQLVKNAVGNDAIAQKPEFETKLKPALRNVGAMPRVIGVYRPMTGTLPSIEQRPRPSFLKEETAAVQLTAPSAWFKAMCNLAAVFRDKRLPTIALPGHDVVVALMRANTVEKRSRDTTEITEKCEAISTVSDEKAHGDDIHNEDAEEVAMRGEEDTTVGNRDACEAEEDIKEKEANGKDGAKGQTMKLEEKAVALRQVYGTGGANRKRAKVDKLKRTGGS